MIFNIMGFGEAPGEFDQRRLDHVREAFGPSLAIVADALGLPLDSFETKGELALARNDTQIAAGLIKAGTVAGQRLTVTGMHAGKPLMQFRANWFVTEDIDQDWELAPTGWRVRVQGDTPMDVSIVFPIKPEDMAATTPGYTAHRAVNAVPAVCEAAPGIRTTPELPQIIAQLG
jgi:4-hydroxy-tetrahydrodipicolinate reductase